MCFFTKPVVESPPKHFNDESPTIVKGVSNETPSSNCTITYSIITIPYRSNLVVR